MLTAPVTIAVFAAFHIRFDLQSVSDAEFKPVWPIRQRDISCYGWQKRQDVATWMARIGKVGGKNGNVANGSGHIHIAAPTAAMEWDCHVCLTIQSSRRTGNPVASCE